MDLTELSTSVLNVQNHFNDLSDETDNDAELLEEVAKYLESLEQRQIDNVKWASKVKRNTKNGQKLFYKCYSCAKMIYALKLRTSLHVRVYVEDSLHQHNDSQQYEA
ncbi:hypothetical protein BpHYR1_033491 [Brachionus plicatilis]|uniref:Uncharacterized protein n=1 Tax=Brachionus plicatilis TaxID=10195 RepID=A0A3M7QW45_BRAPC|nr:hypothetical protein BpHYR1_033491 [Brachionus plicatilis]